MSYEQDRAHDRTASDAGPYADPREPGRASHSQLLRKPATSVASGILARKPRDANGVAEGADHAVAAAASSSGSALPGALLRKFEASLGADLSAVRVHTGDASAAANDAVGAKAYTLGQDIHFGAGHYNPSSPAGEHLLAHEVAHTVQQAGGAQRMQYQLAVSSPGDHLEHEADRAADAMVKGAGAIIGGHSATALLRAQATDTSKDISEPRKDAVTKLDDDPEAMSERWEQVGGPALIDAVRAELARWRLYRKSPATAEAMPRNAILAALAKFPDNLSPALKEHASRQLGPADLAMLEDLLAMNQQGHALPTIFNVVMRKPIHQYEITFTATQGITHASVVYKNNLPAKWQWTSPPIAITGLAFSINLCKPGPPVSPGLEINGTMALDEPTDSYWGWRDFAGKVTVVNFPSAGVTSAVGGPKISTGTGVLFTSSMGTLSFSDLSVKLGIGSAKGNDIKMEYNIGFSGGAGGAYVFDDSKAAVTSQDVATKARLVDASKEFKARITHFENGSDALPADTQKDIKLLTDLVTDFVTSEFGEAKHAEALHQNGIDPTQAFHPEIEVQGWASVRWADAKNEGERIKRNVALSERRANAVASALMGLWGPWTYNSLTVKGLGEGIYANGNNVEAASDAKQDVALLTTKLSAKRESLERAKAKKDSQAIATLQGEILELEAEIESYKTALTPPESAKNGAYESWLRQVAICVRWKGKVVDLGAPSANEPSKGAAGGAMVLKPPSTSVTLIK